MNHLIIIIMHIW